VYEYLGSRYGRECKFRAVRSIVANSRFSFATVVYFSSDGEISDKEVQHVLVDSASEGRKKHVAGLLVVHVRASAAVDRLQSSAPLGT
jgi:hypothetical protein